MILPDFKNYVAGHCPDLLHETFCSFLFEQGSNFGELSKRINAELSGFKRPASLGFLVGYGENKLLFTQSIQKLTKIQFEKSSRFILHDLALLGCYLGIQSISEPKIEKWFQTILELKRGLGGIHREFCDALAGSINPDKNFLELGLFMNFCFGGCGPIFQMFNILFQEFWKSPFPYHNDFFRDTITVRLLELGIEHLTNRFSGESGDVVILSPAEKAQLAKASQLERTNELDQAIRLSIEVFTRWPNSPELQGLFGIQSRASTLKTNRIKGTFSTNESTIERNRISSDFQDLIRIHLY